MGEPNWAENEILRLASKYGDGRYKFFVHADGKAQRKQYGKYVVAYPDIENYRETLGIVLLVEVKGRRFFHKNNGYLGLKNRQKNSYSVVQNKEGVPVRIVYLIGNKNSYDLYWAKLWEIDDIVEFREMWQDINDKDEELYLFFHANKLKTDVKALFEV